MRGRGSSETDVYSLEYIDGFFGPKRRQMVAYRSPQ